MTSPLTKCLVVMTILGMALVACGDRSKASASSESTQLSPEATAKASPAAGQTKRNACALVDREALEAIAGQSLTALHNIEDEDQSTCEFYGQDNTLLIAITVHWKGGKELARAQQAALSMAKQQFLNEEDVDIEELTGSGKVRGLADKAYYSDIMPSWVLKGDVMIEIISPRFGSEQTKKVFLTAMKQALSRLPD